MALPDAFDALYRAFSGYGRSAQIDACPCCVDKLDQDVLTRGPLRGLDADELGKYAFKAMTTWGDAADYKHFLPRILELAIGGGRSSWPGLELEIIAGKLQMAGVQSWPAPELAALRECFFAWWQAVLARDPEDGAWRASDVLPAIACVIDDISPFLDAWRADRSLTGALQLAEFIQANWADIANRGHLHGLWRVAEGREAVARWLVDPERKQMLEHAFERHLDKPAANRLAEAVDAWQWMTPAAPAAAGTPRRSDLP